jgi:hypothetical protein
MAAGISAGCAFLISLIFGLIGKAVFLIALARALIFAGLFFVLVVGIYYIYDKFLQPDANNDDTDDADEVLGQNVEYSVGDDSDWGGGGNDVPDDILGLDYTLEDPADLPSDESGLHEDNTDSIKSLVAGLTDISPSNAALSEASNAAASKGLEQIDSNEYSNNGDLTQPIKAIAPDKAAPKKAAASKNEDYDVDMDVFVPYTPADYGGGEAASIFQSKHTVSEDSSLRKGTVDMSLERKSGKKELDFDNIDGKKVAGAIQTLLKKDEG